MGIKVFEVQFYCNAQAVVSCNEETTTSNCSTSLCATSFPVRNCRAKIVTSSLASVRFDA
jgi:hypothetical protein